MGTEANLPILVNAAKRNKNHDAPVSELKQMEYNKGKAANLKKTSTTKETITLTY
jgi:hypothetical protein